ncbi:unnamed protein product [Orchesella dallaii]|uniref:Uncharacterized protein n=1 Tax=Orchesella dallaii TaxID=48710 RepID=A0ABP1QUQ4_9HEXA
MRQLGVYITAPCLVTIALAAYQTLEMFKEDWCYMMTQRFILSELDHDVLRRHSIFKIKIGEALMYLMFLGFLTFPIVMASVTLLRDNDPVQLILRGLLRTFLPSWLIKLITSLIYAGIVSHGAATILTIVLIAVALVDAARKLSAQLSFLPRRQNTGRGAMILRREFKNRLKLYPPYTPNTLIRSVLKSHIGYSRYFQEDWIPDGNTQLEPWQLWRLLDTARNGHSGCLALWQRDWHGLWE